MKRSFFLIVSFLFLFGFSTLSVGADGSSDTGSGDSWLIMLYQDADDWTLEESICYDLNEAENAGSSDQVTVVSQLDRFDGSYDGDGDWAGTRRYLISYDDDLDWTESRVVEDLGEANMADGDTLKDFCVWAITNYPADKYALILSDHGSGWPGGWSDPDPEEGDMLWTFEMADAMKGVLSETGIDSIDLLGFDACLMGHLEVFASFAPYCDYVVASQETEPGIGWAYNAFIEAVIADPLLNGAGLGRAIVDSYIYYDLTISDRSFTNRYSGDEEVGDYVEYMVSDTTLSAIDLSALETFRRSFNRLLVQLQYVAQEDIAQARMYAQSFTNIFDESQPSPYIDLGHFLSLLLGEIDDGGIKSLINEVLEDLDNAVIAEKHGNLKPGSTGISIFFPNSAIYKADWGGMESYAYSVPNFMRTYSWDEFLLSHYTGAGFSVLEEEWDVAEAEVEEESPEYDEYDEEEEEQVWQNWELWEDEEYIAIPEEDVEITAPGYGMIGVENIAVDYNVISGDDFVTLSADIIGDNIAYIYLEVLYYDPESEYFLVADRDYIEADDTYEYNGIYYPDWSSEGSEFELVFDWEPILYAIDNGSDSAFALVEPYDYGIEAEDTIYTVDGLYYSTGEEEELYAVCYFNGEGALYEIYGYNGDYGLGAPYEISVQPGDFFGPYESWVTWDEYGNEEWDYEICEYIELTNSETPLEWWEEEGFVGEYYVGFVVEDFDGNLVSDYVYVEVVE